MNPLLITSINNVCNLQILTSLPRNRCIDTDKGFKWKDNKDVDKSSFDVHVVRYSMHSNHYEGQTDVGRGWIIGDEYILNRHLIRQDVRDAILKKYVNTFHFCWLIFS